MDRRTTKAVLQTPFCETLLNFNTIDGGTKLRKGDSVWTATLKTAPNNTDDFLAFVKYGDTKLFYTTQGNTGNNRYFDITTATPSLAYTSTSTINGEIFTFYFNKYVYTFGTSSTGSDGDYYNGSTWGTWAWTLPGSLKPIGGCAYKNRAYLIGRASTTYAYGGIDAISGTLTQVDLGSLTKEFAYLSTIAPVTIVTNGNTLILLAFVFFNGEVLFYDGSYPDSPTWGLLARGKTGPPLNYNSYIDYQGDALLLTQIGLVSLRDIFLNGQQQATTKTMSEAIDPLWTALVEYAKLGGTIYWDNVVNRIKYATGTWWPIKNRIIISFPFSINSSGTISVGNTSFVYDTLRNAWSIHRSGRLTDNLVTYSVVEFRGDVYINGYGTAATSTYLTILKKEGASIFQDAWDNTTLYNYDFDLLSAPIPFPKNAVYETTTIEPIIESDLYAQTNWNLVADFGRQTSGNGVLSDPALPSTISKPAVDIGMQNITFVQVEMSGTTTSGKSVGLNLYSYNVWYDSGEIGSR